MSAGDELRNLAKDLLQAVRVARQKVVDANAAAAEAIGDNYKATARRSAKPRRGGHMADSVQVESDKGGLRMIVGPALHHAFFQEHGTSSITGDNALRNASERVAAVWVADLERIGEELL